MPRINAEITEGVLRFDENFLSTWATNQKDGKFIIGIKKYTKPRSLSENAYYWGVVIKLLCGHTGYTPEEMHDCLKTKFLPHLVDEFGLEHIKNTKGLSTNDFEEYLTEVRQFASQDLQVYIPLPNENEDINY